MLYCVYSIYTVFQKDAHHTHASDPAQADSLCVTSGKGNTMDIIISNSSGKPIYEQIADQIKEQIMAGSLPAGDALPSMRLLARELRISVITTKRAYEELERDGFVESVPGKGCFVAPQNREFLREAQLRKVEEHLSLAVAEARKGALTLDELQEMLNLLYHGDNL